MRHKRHCWEPSKEDTTEKKSHYKTINVKSEVLQLQSPCGTMASQTMKTSPEVFQDTEINVSIDFW
jgi:hypothetical protein